MTTLEKLEYLMFATSTNRGLGAIAIAKGNPSGVQVVISFGEESVSHGDGATLEAAISDAMSQAGAP